MNEANINELNSREIDGGNLLGKKTCERKLRDAIVGFSLLAFMFVLIFALEKILPRTSMLFTVLKKGAIYALVAVSMNLLNGFTGLFSLGQAGFMMIGAYTYAVFTIPVAQRAAVYQYFDGGIIQFTVPVFAAIIMGGGHRGAVRFFDWPSRLAFEVRLPCDCHARIFRNHASDFPMGQTRNDYERLEPFAKISSFPLDAFSVRGERDLHCRNRAFDKFHLRTSFQGDSRRRSGGRSDGNKFGASQKNEFCDFLVFRGDFRRAFGYVPDHDSGEPIQERDDI